MIFDGNYSFFINGESKTKEEIKDLIHSEMSVTVDGILVNFISPKKEKRKPVIFSQLKFEEGIRKAEEHFKYPTNPLITESLNSAQKKFMESWSEPNQIELLARLAKEINNKQSTYSKLEDTSIPAKKDEKEIDVSNLCLNIEKQKNKIQELLEEIDKHQEQNGGRVVGVEFPFDAVLTPPKNNFISQEEKDISNFLNFAENDIKKREQKVIEDWNRVDLNALIDVPKFNEIGAKEIKTEGIKESQTVKKAPIFTYCKQMKNAIEALSLRSLYGHERYEKGDDWENFSRVENGEFEYANASFRHALGIGEEDEKNHLIAEAWNAVAKLEIYLRNNAK